MSSWHDPAAAEWLDFFARGGSHFVPYNLPYISGSRKDERVAGVGVGGLALAFVPETLNLVADASYFDRVAQPMIGVSRQGLHLPNVPVVLWEDVVAFSFEELRAHASNGAMIPDPGVGSDRSSSECRFAMLVQRAGSIRQSVTPGCERLVQHAPTAAGADWGSIYVPLGPGLGPEQIVELAYLIGLVAASRGIPVRHAGGLTADFAIVKQFAAIAAIN